jgi:hypothetical protein
MEKFGKEEAVIGKKGWTLLQPFVVYNCKNSGSGRDL